MSAFSFRRLVMSALPFLLIAAIGIFLRVHSFRAATGAGFDEQIYSIYVKEICREGPDNYSDIVRLYLHQQAAYPIALLPPTRITFILAGATWKALFGGPAVESLRAVSCTTSILILLLSCAMAWRVRGRAFALAALALMAVAPTQVYMAHWALIDGFFTCITLLVIWSLWELLQGSPPGRLWLGLYSLGLVLLVLTKENAAFVYLAVLGLCIASRKLGLGRVSLATLVATLTAPLAGVLILILCAGGIGPLLNVFSLNAAKSLVTPYAILTGDGPWFRYLSDLLLVSPAVMLFAIGGAFLLPRTDKVGWYLLGFIFLTYLTMCNVPNGMNLRYANIVGFSASLPCPDSHFHLG